LEIKLQSDFSAQEVNVGVRGMSMAYDADAKRHEMVRISIPKYISKAPLFKVQCYPNPFSSSTQVYFDLPESGKVELQVTDYTGKLVFTNSHIFESSGRHYFDLDGRDLKDGVYLVSVSFESYSGDARRVNYKVVLQR